MSSWTVEMRLTTPEGTEVVSKTITEDVEEVPVMVTKTADAVNRRWSERE